MIGSDPVPLQLTTNRSGKSRRRAGSDGTDLHALRHRNRLRGDVRPGRSITELPAGVGSPRVDDAIRIKTEAVVTASGKSAEGRPRWHGDRHRMVRVDG